MDARQDRQGNADAHAKRICHDETGRRTHPCRILRRVGLRPPRGVIDKNEPCHGTGDLVTDAWGRHDKQDDGRHDHQGDLSDLLGHFSTSSCFPGPSHRRSVIRRVRWFAEWTLNDRLQRWMICDAAPLRGPQRSVPSGVDKPWVHEAIASSDGPDTRSVLPSPSPSHSIRLLSSSRTIESGSLLVIAR